MKNYTPKHLTKWTYPDSYCGPTFYEYYVFFGQNRDSDLLTQSNFICALEQLGGESDTVQVIRQGHWACGWIELIMIHENDAAALIKADEIKKDYDNYPVIDDDHFSQLEYESYSEYAENDKESLADFLDEVFDIPEELRNDTLELAYQLNLETQLNNGEDSSFHHNIYNFRQTGDFDTRHLERMLSNGDLTYNLKDNKALEYITACLGLTA